MMIPLDPADRILYSDGRCPQIADGSVRTFRRTWMRPRAGTPRTPRTPRPPLVPGEPVSRARLAPKVCPGCGIEFQPRRVIQSFHDRACYRAYRQNEGTMNPNHPDTGRFIAPIRNAADSSAALTASLQAEADAHPTHPMAQQVQGMAAAQAAEVAELAGGDPGQA
jgi:hypothetical protein